MRGERNARTTEAASKRPFRAKSFSCASKLPHGAARPRARPMHPRRDARRDVASATRVVWQRPAPAPRRTSRAAPTDLPGETAGAHKPARVSSARCAAARRNPYARERPRRTPASETQILRRAGAPLDTSRPGPPSTFAEGAPRRARTRRATARRDPRLVNAARAAVLRAAAWSPSAAPRYLGHGPAECALPTAHVRRAAAGWLCGMTVAMLSMCRASTCSWRCWAWSSTSAFWSTLPRGGGPPGAWRDLRTERLCSPRRSSSCSRKPNWWAERRVPPR